MFYHIIKNEDKDDDSDAEDLPTVPKELLEKAPEKKHAGVLKNKIKFVSKLLKMQKLLR